MYELLFNFGMIILGMRFYISLRDSIFLLSFCTHFGLPAVQSFTLRNFDTTSECKEKKKIHNSKKKKMIVYTKCLNAFVNVDSIWPGHFA